MCGISFYYSKESTFSCELKDSLESTKHRGPDALGQFEINFGNSFIGLGHNRLSIIELSDAGSQPMHDGQGISLVFNGEAYNHHYLRSILVEKGYKFEGKSDTEVILKLYVEYGVEAFSMIEGMFGLVVLDVNKSTLYIVRDSIGIKPLYIARTEKGIFGSSEIKGLKPYLDNTVEIDSDDVYEFFNTGFLYEPATGFKNIKKLMPGSIMSINLDTGDELISYLKAISEYGNKMLFRESIESAISKQLIADVPLGVFFSGGADSSIIASMSGDADLFFAEFSSDSSSDIDKKYSKLIANYYNKKLVTHKFLDSEVSVQELIDQVSFVAKNTEEPISDYTFWATYQLSIAARNSGYKVMLSGMGGDEIFAGYPRYHILNKHFAFKLFNPVLKLLLKLKLFPKKLNKRFSRLVSYSSEISWGVAYSRLLGYFSRDELKELFGARESDCYDSYADRLDRLLGGYDGDLKNKVKMGQYLDKYGFLSHNLMVSDKASMLASIELRVPLLDEALVAYGLSEKSERLIDIRRTKKPLKDVLKSCLPDRFIERPKTGFNPPLDSLINKIGKERLIEELSDIGGFVDEVFALKLIDNHFSQEQNNSYKIWQLLYFKYWIKNLND